MVHETDGIIMALTWCCVASHTHAYERSRNVYNYELDSCAPMYITIGESSSMLLPVKSTTHDVASFISSRFSSHLWEIFGVWVALFESYVATRGQMQVQFPCFDRQWPILQTSTCPACLKQQTTTPLRLLVPLFVGDAGNLEQLAVPMVDTPGNCPNIKTKAYTYLPFLRLLLYHLQLVDVLSRAACTWH